MEKQANIGIKGQDFYGYCPHCTTHCKDELSNLLSGFCRGLVIDVIGNTSGTNATAVPMTAVSDPYWPDQGRFSFVHINDPDDYWAELTPLSTKRVECLCECGYGFSGGGVTDKYGNPVIRGGSEVRNRWNVFGKLDRLNLFPLCGELEIQYSGNNYHRFTREQYIEPVYDYSDFRNSGGRLPPKLITPGHYVTTNKEVFFLLLKSVCSDTSPSKRSQHPHMVGVDRDYHYKKPSRSDKRWGKWKSRGREFDINEFPKKMGLSRQTIGYSFGTVTEIESCDTQECQDTCDGFTTGPPWRKRGDPSPWNCATITNGVYTTSMNCRASTVFVAGGLQTAKQTGLYNPYDGDMLGVFSTYDDAYDAVVREHVRKYTGSQTSGASSYDASGGDQGVRGDGGRVIPCQSRLMIYGGDGNQYSFADSDSVWPYKSVSKSALGRSVRLGSIGYSHNLSTQGNIVGANLNNFNVFTDDDSFDLSSTDRYYPVSVEHLPRTNDHPGGGQGYYSVKGQPLGLEFYQAHLSYRGDGAAINTDWLLDFGSPIFSKAFSWGRSVVGGRNIDAPPMRATWSLK